MDPMAKVKKRPRPKADSPKGFRDYFGTEVTERTEMLATIAEVYRRHGFDALESPSVETVEALGKFLPDVDRPNEGVFAWREDGDGDWLALRYDLTAPLARVYAQHRNDLPTPYRRYSMGPVWRNEKPDPGRFRQFYQCDADTVGAATVAADAEMCAMLADALEAVGIARGDYVIRVNNRKILSGVVEAAGLLDPADPAKFEEERGIVLRAIDKMDRIGADGVRALLGGGREDESGDFTKGAGLGEDAIQTVMDFVRSNEIVEKELREGRPINDDRIPPGPSITVENPLEGTPHVAELWNWAVLDHLFRLAINSKIGEEGLQELAEMRDYLRKLGYADDRIVVDPTVVRGLGYYTGPVFEAELTFEIKDGKGRPRRFGSVAGGGRYDGLVKRFTGQEVPATGVSIGVDRLLAALRAKKLADGVAAGESAGPVVVTVMDRDRIGEYLRMAKELRDAGIRAEIYHGNPRNFGAQLKYADRRGSPVAVIQGGDEMEKGVVQLKNLVLGAKIAESASLDEWKSQPAQTEVARGKLVDGVREMLKSVGSEKPDS